MVGCAEPLAIDVGPRHAPHDLNYRHTLVTSAFSHMDGNHLTVNMIGLFFMGPAVAS